MLVLSRKKDESIVINNDITIVVVEIRGDKVRLGVEAPKEVPVHRREVYDAIARGDDLTAPHPGGRTDVQQVIVEIGPVPPPSGTLPARDDQLAGGASEADSPPSSGAEDAPPTPDRQPLPCGQAGAGPGEPQV